MSTQGQPTDSDDSSTELSENRQRERRWINRDPTDTGVEIDSEYIKPESKRADVSFTEDSFTTDGGQSIAVDAKSNGIVTDSQSENDPASNRFVDAYEKSQPNGFATGSPARTKGYFEPGSIKWKLQQGLDVERAGDDWGIPYKSREKTRFEAMATQLLGESAAANRVVGYARSDDRSNVWNRWHNGNESKVVGYAVYILGDGDIEKGTEKLIENSHTTLGHDREEIVYAGNRAAERFD